MSRIPSFSTRAFAVASLAAAGFVPSAFAVDPIVMWDGAESAYNFSTLTRTVDIATYTLAVNNENATISADKTYIEIGSENQKWTVNITSDAEAAFGRASGSGFTAIALVSHAGTSEGANRAILNYHTSYFEAALSLAQAPGGKVFPVVSNGAQSLYATPANTLLSDGTIQTVALTYDTTDGVRLFVDGSLQLSNNSLTIFEGTPDGITLGGVPIDGSNKLFALKGMRIYAIALFDTRLTDQEVAAFSFPSRRLTVSTINKEYGGSEINVEVADGVTVIGDTTFDATHVHFICSGSFTLKPPAGNAATFDFSGVSGKTRILYEGSLPTVSGTTFTATTIPASVADPSQWTGTIWLRNIADVTDFNVNSYGNASSCVRLTGITGWLSAPGNYTYTNTVPVELSDEGSNTGSALKITNGNSPDNNKPLRCTAFVKISGEGTLYDFTYARPVIKVFDLNEFSGTISLAYGTSLIVCDPTTVYGSLVEFYSHPGSFRIESGKAVAVPANRAWTVKNIFSDGTLSGGGKISVGGDAIPSGSSFTNETWEGTLSVVNVATAEPLNIHLLGNANSIVELSSIGANSAFLANGACTMAGKVVLTDIGTTPALALNNGYSDACTTIRELAGTGTFTQRNASISQGITINVMTNFTGTLALNKMTVTFGTKTRSRATSDTSKFFVDPDAVLSVPAGFRLWAPAAVVLDGPIDFQTDAATNYKDLVLLDNLGSGVQQPFGANFAVSINGTPLGDLPGGTSYKLKLEDGQLVLKRFGVAFRFR